MSGARPEPPALTRARLRYWRSLGEEREAASIYQRERRGLFAGEYLTAWGRATEARVNAEAEYRAQLAARRQPPTPADDGGPFLVPAEAQVAPPRAEALPRLATDPPTAEAVLAALAQLGRPASAAEVADVLGADPLAVRLILRRWQRQGRVRLAADAADEHFGNHLFEVTGC